MPQFNSFIKWIEATAAKLERPARQFYTQIKLPYLPHYSKYYIKYEELDLGYNDINLCYLSPQQQNQTKTKQPNKTKSYFCVSQIRSCFCQIAQPVKSQ